MDKRSTFANPSDEESKASDSPILSKSVVETKKNFGLLHVHVAKANEIHRWQEISLSANLPERRSHCCSCVYKSKYFY